MWLFGRWRGSRDRKQGTGTVSEAVRTVERALQDSGVDPAHATLEQEGCPVHLWELPRNDGETTILIAVTGRDEDTLLTIRSPVMHLPPSNLLPFYRRLLEANSEMAEAAFSVSDDVVSLETSRGTLGLDPDEVIDAINLLGRAIEQHAMPIREEFQATAATNGE